MASLHSMMVTSDPRMEKENLVPRIQRAEPGTGSLRARGLTSGEQRSSAVLRESSLQNLAPGPVNISKGGLGSVEKDRFKTFSSDPSKGKTTTGSLELLKEKLGQLKSASVLKQPSQKTSSTHEPSGVSDFSKRGPTPTTGNESKVQVYRDVKQSNSSSGGLSKDSSRMESQRRLREANSKSGSCSLSVPIPIKAAKSQETHENHSTISPSTPTKSMSSTFSRTSKGTPYKKGLPPMEDDDTTSQSGQRNHCREGPVQSTNQSQHINKVEAGVALAAEKSLHKESSRSQIDGGIEFHGEKLKTGTDKTAPSITPPHMEDANSDDPIVAASGGVSAAIEKLSRTNISKRAKCSRFGPALRVRVRDNPKFPGKKENHSPGSETSSDNDHMNPEVLATPASDDVHDKILANTDSEPHPDPTKEDDNFTKGSAVGTLGNFSLLDPRKRKPEADPSTTDTSLMTGCATHSLGLDVQIEDLHKSENILENERLGSNTSREFRSQSSIRDQTGDSHTGDTSERPTVGQTKGTPVSEREPWAWKTTRDSRSLSHPSPTFPDQSRTGKVNGGIPPRYLPPTLGLREQGPSKSETDEPVALEVHKHSVGPMKREAMKVDDTGRPELKKEVTPGGSMSARSLSHADDAAVNLLSNTLSTISIGEKNASGSSSHSKHSLQGKINTHHLIGLSAESGSLTGLTGVTGVTSQSMEQRAPLPSSQVTELSQKSSVPHSVQEKESVCRPEFVGQNGFSKGTTKASTLSSEGPVHEPHATKSSSYEAPREKMEKNEEEPPPNPQMQRKIRHEIENDKFVFVNGTRYQKLGKIGKGGSSEVFKVIAMDCSIYALKRINLKGRDYSTARGFYQEIEYLEALRGKRHIIQLIDSEVTNKKVLDKRRVGGDITEEAFIYMVLEYGEIDLAGILSDKRKKLQSNSDRKLDENWLRYNWQQILEAVRTIHDERIVHSDLKPANFLLVQGELKLIDFGIAKAIQNDTTNIVRDSQVGTLNYMAPEAFLQNQTDEDGVEIKQGRASDIWSLGCILYQMVYGLTPFAELSFYSKIQAITNPHHKINYPPVPNPWLVDIMKKCLTWDRKKRLRIPELLQHPFIQPSLTPLIPIRQHVMNGFLSKQQVMQNVKTAITSNLPVEWVAELCKELLEESENAMVKLAYSSRSVRYNQAQTISNT